MNYELYYNNKSNVNWGKYVKHIYNIRNKVQNELNCIELKNISISTSGIFSYKYYNVISIWKTYKYIKQAAIIEAIREAYKLGYNNILIISDEVKFINSVHIDNILQNLTGDICILNPSDISKDCLYLNKYAINYIANLQINFSEDWLESTIDNIKSNLNITKSYLDICYHKIDYVVTYVNNNDPKWLKDYEIFKSESNLNYNKQNRWAAHDDLFKLHLDNIRKYIPWVNNIYLVVSSESQIPSYIDTDINIVLHKDIIPNEFLPTFNSCTIEMFIHNISGLSEHFIYANDDTIILNGIDKYKFFHDGKICANTQIIDTNTLHHRICKHGLNLINIEFNKEINEYIKFTHTPHPMLLSSCKHISSIQSNNINQSITRFRSIENYNQYLFLYYNYIINAIDTLNVSYKYVKVIDNAITINEDIAKYKKYDIICFNDIYTNNLDKISVIVPIYNAGNYLSKCIESIINQTYTNLEIILINDGSKDNSKQICEEYAEIDSRIIFIDKKNEGVAVTRNIGINKSTGAWISFVDADDWLSLDRYDIMLNAAKINNTQIVKCSIEQIRINNTKSKWYVPEGLYTIQDKLILSSPLYDNSGVANNIYKTSLIKDNNLYFRDCDMGEDYLFNAEAFTYSGSLYSIDIPLYHYQRHEGSLSNTVMGPGRYSKMLNSFNDVINALSTHPNFKYFKDILVNNFYNRNSIKNMRKNCVDVVIPYVDSSDINWITEYNKYADIKINPEINGVERFRSNDELFKYVFRGIEKYMPWINTIHLLVMCDSQVPQWINRNTIHVVYHTDFMPNDMLPTFNSSTIEMFIKDIPGLSEKFIYANDDFYYTYDLYEKFYFKDNQIKSRLEPHPLIEKQLCDIPIWKKIFLNSYYLATEGKVREPNLKTENKYFVPPHIEQGLTKTLLNKVWDLYKNEMINSCTRFRSTKNLNQYLYTDYAMTHNLGIDGVHSYRNFNSSSNAKNIINTIANPNKNAVIRSFVLNDTGDLANSEIALTEFKKLFSNKSKYEI